MPTTAVNGVQLYWELTGAVGDPLILVHGSWVDHHSWDLVVPKLAGIYRVLTYDRRGHSQSERGLDQGGVREDVSDLAALIEHLHLAPAHIAGNSFGGSIVLRLAGERPDLFRSMIIHEPPLFRLLAHDPATRRMLDAIEERMAAVMDLCAAGNAAGAAQQFVEMVAFHPGAWSKLPSPLQQTTFVSNASTWVDEMHDPEALHVDVDALRRWSHPLLVTQGAHSAPVFLAVVEKLAQALPAAQISIFPDAGHVPHVTHPREYTDTLMAFTQGRPTFS